MTPAVSAPAGIDLDPAAGHWLHDPSRTWSETNCYADLWVQLLHRLGLDPRPALAFTVAARVDGEQWTFAKPPAEDLERLYGIRVLELLVWRPLAEHIELAAQHGDLLTVEVDAYYLPDVAGSSYRTRHEKTTIVPVRLDGHAMTYLHNGVVGRLDGDDLAGALPADGASDRLAPYVELVALGDLRRTPPDPAAVRSEVRRHLARRRPGNPVTALADLLAADLPWLTGAGVETFHGYAFATLRQCGATATLAGALAGWLDDHPDPAASGVGCGVAREAFDQVADGAKSAQFQLARAARGRSVDLSQPLADMAQAWATAIEAVTAQVGVPG